MRKPGEKHRHGRMQLPGRLGCHSESSKWDWKWGQESEPRRKGNSSGSQPVCPAQHVAWEGLVGEGLGGTGRRGPGLAPPSPGVPSGRRGGRNWAPNHRKDDSQSTKVCTGTRNPRIGPRVSHKALTHRASALGIFNLNFFFLRFNFLKHY